MCEFFVKADPILYESRTRTIRIHGVLTSIRLENLAWDVLAEMAAQEGCTTNSLIAKFHDEILQHRGEVGNFASFLRVTCMRHLRRKIDEGGAARAAPPREVAREMPRDAPRESPQSAPRVLPLATRGART
jgi:predicted DNA-binding ribbon-helix-helix protein